MGRYSDSDSELNRKQKKKKKKRSRTRSRSPSSEGSRYSHSRTTKHKKSKKKHRHRSKSRSRSRSSDRYSRRERSPARRRRSRSHDRGRSPRSYERSRRSSSYSRDRRSRSGSRDSRRTYSRRRSASRERSRRSRSVSTSREHSRRSSPDKRKGRQSPVAHGALESLSIDDIPGFNEMTPAEQAQLRLKMALKAAAAADERLKENMGTSSPSQWSASPRSRQQFSDAVASIESDAFVPTTFKSSRSSKNLKDTLESSEMSLSGSHSAAMFGAVGSSVVFTKTEPLDKSQLALEDNPETLFDKSILDATPEEKMQRWIQKLTVLRRKRLEADCQK